MFGAPDDATTEKEPSLDQINLKIPRHVRLSANGSDRLQVASTCVCVAVILLGGLAWYLAHDWHQHTALQRDGVEATAQVTYISHGRGSSVRYLFQVGEASYRNSLSYSNAPGRLSVGSQFPVLYLPSDPTINYPEGWGWSDFGLIFICIYVGAIPSSLGVRATWNLLRDHHLARHGMVTEGKVTLCVAQRSGNNYMVDYEFRTQSDFRTQKDEEALEGSDNNCPDEYKTGAKIRVIYLPHQPKRNNSYPLELWQMVEPKAHDGPFLTER